MTPWFLYMIRSPDNALYTGITTDVPRRVKQHQSGKGAKALRGKTNLLLVFSTEVGDHGRALRLEYRMKQLKKSQKEQLVSGEVAFEDLFADLQTQDITGG
ncbi:GIY-YIG nuclease family protein [Shimwellia pseudoproteus]|uniref:GIY-YIG nuclease family protein n=1 Tax=Shimwellia pseudoproteus TaxID=570012 RepID=UPI0018ECFBF7|nr:GIY-YIG nuclease family protein [Shimwellia pseudoproteus]MBJ3815328.1 GIY-YIG nuclease family protein [Shimwellia pseudoproteus]